MELTTKLLGPDERRAWRDWLIENNLRAKCRWPYLYKGGPVETSRVISSYVEHPGCIVAMAFDAAEPVAVEMTNPVGALPAGFGAQLGAWASSLGASHDKVYWANWLIVDPAWRGEGLGARLMDLTTVELKRRGAELWVFDVLYRRLPDRRAPPGYANDTSYYEKYGFRRAMTPPLVTSWVDIGDDKPSPKAYFTYYKDLR